MTEAPDFTWLFVKICSGLVVILVGILFLVRFWFFKRRGGLFSKTDEEKQQELREREERKNRQDRAYHTNKKCPYCAEEIREDAIKCRHCNEILNKHDNENMSARYVVVQRNFAIELASMIVLICGVVLFFIFFHIAPDCLSIFPKEFPSIADTFIGGESFAKRYNEADFLQKISMRQSYMFRKLSENGCIASLATASVQEIGSTMAPAICEKYSSCNQNPLFKKGECLKDIAAGIVENLKKIQGLNVDQGTLNGCVKAVKAAACEALNNSTPPTGCEFLQ